MEINNIKRLVDDIFAYPIDRNVQIVARNIWTKQRNGQIESKDALIDECHNMTNNIWNEPDYDIIVENLVNDCIDFMNDLRHNKLDLSDVDSMILDMVYNVGLSTNVIAKIAIGDKLSKEDRRTMMRMMSKGYKLDSIANIVGSKNETERTDTNAVDTLESAIDDRLDEIICDFRDRLIDKDTNIALDIYKKNTGVTFDFVY